MLRTILLFTLSLILSGAHAQREEGSWQDYLSYGNASKVTFSEDKVFCATEGGVFYYNLNDNSVNKLKSFVALSDFGVQTIAYSLQDDVLVIAYENSNIDLVYDDGTVINLSDIKRKIVSGDKSIYNISFYNNEVYLSCGFGVVVLNLAKREVKDTYYIGEGGAALVINDVDFFEDNIFAASNKGIYKAPLSGANLLDYSSWEQVENIPNSNLKYNQLVVHGGKLIANYTPDEWYQDEMYALQNGVWEPYQPGIKFAFDMQSNQGFLSIASRSDIFLIDNNHTYLGSINAYNYGDEIVQSISPKSSVITPDGSLWIADHINALVRMSDDNFEQIYPEGPMDNSIHFVGQFGSQLWVTPGGFQGFTIPTFQKFEDGQWTYFSAKTNDELTGFHNIITVEVDPSDNTHFFVASWGGGLLEYRNNEFVKRYNNLNSPLESALPQQPEEPFTRIGGMAFDEEGNLWMTNAECAHNLHKLSPSGEWESFVLPEIANRYNPTEVIVNSNGDKWVIIPGHDAYVVNRTGELIKRLPVTSYFSNGQEEEFTRMNDVYSIAEDLEGDIWMGTSKGVAVFSNTHRVFDTENYYASRPGLDLNDGIYHPLLETETVTAIAVDGANRKWCGTSNSGVYLISETGEQELLHFTTQNSPLLSNNITSIAINHKTGVVYFGTGSGLIAYQGDAIGGNDTYDQVYVYPNPVRETYDGPVTITGLLENTDVKITDISGNLVYTTTSLGGNAIWDGRNLNGKRVRTGVYLVFCNNENGEETHVGKLLFIH
jgi:sugar lactone lactonase YvrE